MTESQLRANPFALMMEPESVLRVLEQSERLSRLRRRIYRPLDRPTPCPIPGEVERAPRPEVQDGGDLADESSC